MSDLISREALKAEIEKALDNADLSEYEACICVTSIYDKCIDNAPTVNPCKNCDLYFKAMTKEEMRKGGAV